MTLEARESGKSGICRPNGELRFGLIEELLTCELNHETLLFEAPSSELQNYFVKRLGPNVNLGNVAATAVLGLETIRLGLRAETLCTFEGGPAVRESRDAFHLAIPAYHLDDTEDFYVRQLGCKLARRYPDRITLDFFGDQLVCHLTEPPVRREENLALYPRHFGVTFREAEDFEALHRLCLAAQDRDVPRPQCSIRGIGRGAPHLCPARPVRQPDRVQAVHRPQNDVLRCRRSLSEVDSSAASGLLERTGVRTGARPGPFRGRAHLHRARPRGAAPFVRGPGPRGRAMGGHARCVRHRRGLHGRSRHQRSDRFLRGIPGNDGSRSLGGAARPRHARTRDGRPAEGPGTGRSGRRLRGSRRAPTASTSAGWTSAVRLREAREGFSGTTGVREQGSVRVVRSWPRPARPVCPR